MSRTRDLPVLAPTTTAVVRRQYGLLDGLRAIAALMVVGYHAHSRDPSGGRMWDVAAQLNMGVAVFFVLSGFLLYRPFVAARLSAATPVAGLRTYFARRILRVGPAYWVAISVLGLTLPMYVPVLGHDWWIFYTLGQTWVPDRTFDGLAPAWSLSVEASFYALLPLYSLVMCRLLGRRPVRRQAVLEFTALAVVVAATLAARRFVFGRGEGATGFLAWTVLGHADWFAAGLALALASALWEGAPVRPRLVRSLETRPGPYWFAAGAVFAATGFIHGSPGDVVHVLSLAVAVLLVAPAIFGDERVGLVRRLLATPSVQWLGLVSFGVFLWNEPLASYIAAQGWNASGPLPAELQLFFLTTIASVGIGAVSYYGLERPVMVHGRRVLALRSGRSAPVPRRDEPGTRRAGRADAPVSTEMGKRRDLVIEHMSEACLGTDSGTGASGGAGS